MARPINYYSIPHLVHIETTYTCNSRCIFCYNPKRKSSIDYEKIDKIVEAVRKAHIPNVYLIGGEPSLLKVKKLNEYIDLLSETSSVTIVTNGKRYMENLSDKLACLGIPIHGNEKTHDYLTSCKGGYKKTILNIKRYIKEGFDVRCIPVLMSINHNQMYDVIKLATELGMESVFIDRFESGGLGSKMTKKLLPNLKQFKIALGQMIKAKKR
ncbi:MAG: radical SAM protein, partial [Candidatus Pacearchaeota archaeon]|nr:radical SAM protein [Candidatus Pacearchaeota archaeon]